MDIANLKEKLKALAHAIPSYNTQLGGGPFHIPDLPGSRLAGPLGPRIRATPISINPGMAWDDPVCEAYTV